MAHIAEQVEATIRPGDVLVASIHWGGNWGYGIPRQQTRFAHGLIDQAGFDVVHGHSSHHPKGIEVRWLEPGVTNVQIIYICYLVGFVVGVSALIGVVLAYMNRGKATGWRALAG